MIFKILFFISFIGFIIVFYLFKKNRKSKKLLQSFCKSCIIDSVKFEKRMTFFVTMLHRVKKDITSYLKKIFFTAITYKNSFISYSKRNVRKKLFKKEKVERVSEYISEIRK